MVHLFYSGTVISVLVGWCFFWQGLGSVESSDFRVLECPTGELILQSSRNNGDYVSLWSSKYRIKVKKFSVYLLVK